MNGITKVLMRIVLLALLIQFVAPLFLSAASSSDFTADQTIAYHATKNTLVIPQLVKEKEESEDSGVDGMMDLTALIDFTNLSTILMYAHVSRLTPLVYTTKTDNHLPLFKLHRVFIL